MASSAIRNRLPVVVPQQGAAHSQQRLEAGHDPALASSTSTLSQRERTPPRARGREANPSFSSTESRSHGRMHHNRLWWMVPGVFALFCTADVLLVSRDAGSLDTGSIRTNHTSTTSTTLLPETAFHCRHTTSAREIQTCYPAQYMKQLNQPDCSDIVDWTTVQRCLTGRHFHSTTTESSSSSSLSSQSMFDEDNVYNSRIPKIREIHIVGERNSGTKFLTNAIQKCFPKPHVRVHRDFVRGKHFFQPIVPTTTKRDFRSSLVIVIVRDPYEWMASMLEKPYHSPCHVAGFDNQTGDVIPLPWYDFVQRPWTISTAALAASSRDDPLRTALLENATLRHEPLCREEFAAHEVRPCRLNSTTAQGPPWNIPPQKWRGFEPIYELHNRGDDNSGQPYDTLLQLRADKMINWILELPLVLQLGGFLVVRYEDVLQRGNEFLMRQIEEILANQTSNTPITTTAQTPLPCSFTGPQPERLGKRSIPNDFRKWIRDNMNVETERLVGYGP